MLKVNKLALYYIENPLRDKWVKGDRHLINIARKVFGKKNHAKSLEKVFQTLQKSLETIHKEFSLNKPFTKLKPDEVAIVLGSGRNSLENYDKANPIIAGIGLMSHPTEWPDLFEKYPVKYYLQHSEWANNMYKKYYGERCRIWPVGIETDKWVPGAGSKDIDVLVYDKILWDRDANEKTLLEPILKYLDDHKIKHHVIRYGSYRPSGYKSLLDRSKCMLFLCEHESQGIAYQEALSTGVPIIAWDQGFWLDPNRFLWGENDPVPATSVPYFSEECGVRFKNYQEFTDKFNSFYRNVEEHKFNPRKYILEHLTLEKSAYRMLEIASEIK